MATFTIIWLLGLVISPFVGIIIGYMVGGSSDEIGMQMVLYGFLSTAVTMLLIPLIALFVM